LEWRAWFLGETTWDKGFFFFMQLKEYYPNNREHYRSFSKQAKGQFNLWLLRRLRVQYSN